MTNDRTTERTMLIAGGTGLIGKALSLEAKRSGYKVMILSRKSSRDFFQWDPAACTINLSTPLVVDVIVNLAGSSLGGGRWTKKRKKDILKSRQDSCETLRSYIRNGLLKTDLYIGASAVGIYGDRDSQEVNEATEINPDAGWLTKTSIAWEAAHQKIGEEGVRVVILRFGLILDKKAFAFQMLLLPSYTGFLVTFGHGKQYWPWIHLTDVVRIICFVSDRQRPEKVYLVVSPAPETNHEFNKTLNRQFAFKRILLKIPEWMLKIGLGEMRQVLLDSCKGFPHALEREGYSFTYPTLDSALKEIMKGRRDETD